MPRATAPFTRRIEQLSGMNQGRLGAMFQGKLDLQKIGVIGHSVGGAVAYNLAINDRRVKAAIDLDGTVFITPQGKPEAVAPFLMLANDQYHIQAIQNRSGLMGKLTDLPAEEQAIMRSMYGGEEAYTAAYNQAQQNIIGLTEVLKAAGNLFTIQGSDHMKFTDIGLFIGDSRLRDLINIRGTTAPSTCLEITQAVTLAFFDQHLGGATKASLESLVQKYPALKKIDLKSTASVAPPASGRGDRWADTVGLWHSSKYDHSLLTSFSEKSILYKHRTPTPHQLPPNS